MLLRLMIAILVMALATSAEARRIALVVGQDAYPGGGSATIGLPPLSNSRLDAGSIAGVLSRHGFDVVSCDGKVPGCFDLDRHNLLKAIEAFEQQARSADFALIYYAGHGLASDEGNILAPTDARVSCETGEVAGGVSVERLLAAADGAASKLVILDACRNNPIGAICPNLKGKKLSFTRIEPGAMQGLLLVTSTQFGQEALDGPSGTHSPFASALLKSLQAYPSIYFEQLMNEVARLTYDSAKANGGFVQIPGKVVGGAAPADCLAGKNCIGDSRMAALATENESLAAEASGVRAIIAAEEKSRGATYTAEERKKRIRELGDTLARIASSSDPLRQEAKQLIQAGNLKGAETKLDEALSADERSILEAERVAKDKRKAAAQNARDLAVLSLGRDIKKAIEYFKRATRLNPDDAASWQDLGQTAFSTNQLDVAAEAFEQAERKGQALDKPRDRYWALLGLGDIELARGNLERAGERYKSAFKFAKSIAVQRPEEKSWQRDILAAQTKLGDIELALADTASAVTTFTAALGVALQLANDNPKNANRQQDVSIAYQKLADAYLDKGDLAQSLEASKQCRQSALRANELRPGDPDIETSVAAAYEKLGDILIAIGKDDDAFDAFNESYKFRHKLANADPANVDWQRGLSVIEERLGDQAYAKSEYDEALLHFEASLKRMSPIRDHDPGNTAMQRFTVVTMVKVGKTRWKKQDADGALQIYEQAQAIIDNLVKADPANAQWQRDRAVVAEQRGAAFKMRGQNEKAREAFRTALAAYEAMLSRRPGDYQARLFSVVPLSHLSELEPKLARQHLETALAILRDLKTAGRLDAQREGWIATLENNLAELDKPAAAKAPAPAEASSSAGQGTAAARKPLSAASAGLTDRLPSQEGSPRTGKATRKPPRAPNAPPSENSGPLKAPQDSN